MLQFERNFLIYFFVASLHNYFMIGENVFHIKKKRVKNNQFTIKGISIQSLSQCNHNLEKSPYNLYIHVYIWRGFFSLRLERNICKKSFREQNN